MEMMVSSAWRVEKLAARRLKRQLGQQQNRNNTQIQGILFQQGTVFVFPHSRQILISVSSVLFLGVILAHNVISTVYKYLNIYVIKYIKTTSY